MKKSDPNKYLTHLQPIAENIINTVIAKDQEYGSSWKKRGGIGAYMMLVRKCDRLEEQVKEYNYDVFSALAHENAKHRENLKDTMEDMIAYALLILAEMESRNDNKEEDKPFIRESRL